MTTQEAKCRIALHDIITIWLDRATIPAHDAFKMFKIAKAALQL